MNLSRRYLLIVGATTLFLSQQASAQGPGAHSMFTPDQLQWNDVPALVARVTRTEGTVSSA
jgi:hypothetical protein